MNDLDQQNTEFEDDEQIQITDLDPEGSPQRRRAEMMLAVLRKSATRAWVRYGLIGLLFILLGAAFLQFHQPAPATPTPTPTATPQEDGFNGDLADDRLYFQTNDGMLTAYLDENGRVLWHKKLPGQASLRASGQVLYCYYVTAQGQGRLEALSANDGRVVWWNAMPAVKPEQGTGPRPVPVSLQPGDDALYASVEGAIYAFQASDGYLRWAYRYSQSTDQGAPWGVPMLEQGGIVEIQTPDNNVHILNASDGREMLHFQSDSNSSLPQLDGQLIYALPSPGNQSLGQNIQVFRIPDGKRLWRLPLTSGAGPIVEQNGVVYVSSADGSALTALRGSDGHALWTYKTGASETIVGSPIQEWNGRLVEEDGMLYLLLQNTQGNTLVGIRISDGQSIWSTRITAFRGQLSNVAPVFDDGMIFLDNASSQGPGGESNAQPTLIYALRASDGKILWLLKNGRFWMHHDGFASWVRISSDAFEVLLVYALLGSALTFSKDVVVSRPLNRS